MKKFEFQNETKYINGQGVVAKLGKEVAAGGFRKVLILAGGGSIKKNSVYDDVTASLKEAGIEFSEKWGVSPNPNLEHAREALDEVRKSGAEAIIAVGGGSVIDEAKAVACGYYLDDIWDAYENPRLITKALPIYTVLTISAAASEANRNSVLTHVEKNLKWAINHKSLQPVASFVDPTYQFTLPFRQTVNGTFDAFSHILEVYCTATEDDEITLAVNEAIMRTLITSCHKLQNNPEDYHARANLTWANTLALNGITKCGIAGDWSVHAIEHGISGLFPRVTHAEGLAVITPAWILFMSQSNPYLFKRWAKNVFGANTVEEGIARLLTILRSWGAPTKMDDLDISPEHFPKIAELTCMQGNPGVLKELDKDAIITILESTNKL
jgi:alcohol dehydrogenase YqhD (iron-dependent ADH family)